MMDDMELSIRGLSAVTGIRQRELRDIVAGITHPHGSILQRIADALGTDASVLYGRGCTEEGYGNRPALNRANLGGMYDAIDEYVKAGAAFC